MSNIWFVVPAHGRPELSAICLRQLKRTCDRLKKFDIYATAVVIANDENLDTAADLGFWGYDQNNDFLGRKFNDGMELAAQEGAEFVIPMGSDDWLDYRWITAKPLHPNKLRCARWMAMVAEDGRRIQSIMVNYDGGIGPRIIPVSMIEKFRYRPAPEDRKRGYDMATLNRIKTIHKGDFIDYYDFSSYQLIDWKTGGANLNSYQSCAIHRVRESGQVWAKLADCFPAESLREMRAFYAKIRQLKQNPVNRDPSIITIDKDRVREASAVK